MGDLAAAEVADRLFGFLCARLQDDPGAHLLAETLVRHAEDLDVLNVVMAQQEFLDLARIDVLAAADQHVLDPADDLAIALGVDGGQVAGVHPALGVDRLARALQVAPVAAHHQVAAGAQFAPFADRQRPSVVGIDDLAFGVGLNAPDRRDPLFDRIVDRALERDRAGFGHAVGDGDVRHVHVADHLLHGLDRAGRAGHDAGA